MNKIGIVSHPIGPNSFGITTPYLEWLDLFGADIKIIDPKASIDLSLDLLVLPGGPDVDSKRYGEFPHRRATKACQYREYFDTYILPMYIEQGMSIFGICRGLQTLNVLFGGSLHQHVYHPTSIKDRDELVHRIKFRYSHNENIISEKDEVNSLHHQIINLFPSELKVIGRYLDLKHDNKGGSVEAIAHRDLPIAAVQYHPKSLGLITVM